MNKEKLERAKSLSSKIDNTKEVLKRVRNYINAPGKWELCQDINRFQCYKIGITKEEADLMFTLIEKRLTSQLKALEEEFESL